MAEPTNAQNTKSPEATALNEEAQKVFRRVELSLTMRHPDRALATIEPLIQKLEAYATKGPDAKEGSYDFETPEQAYLYFLLNPDVAIEDIRPADLPYVDAYGIRAAVEYQLGDFEASIGSIDAALRWAPTDAGLYLERAMAHEAMGDFDALSEDIDLAYPLITNAIDLARWHAFRADVLISRGSYATAAAHYAVYHDFDTEDTFAEPDEELHALGHATGHGHEYEHLTSEKAQAKLQKAQENYGPSDEALSVLQTIMEDALDEKDLDSVILATRSLWELTHYEGWKEILDRVDEIMSSDHPDEDDPDATSEAPADDEE